MIHNVAAIFPYQSHIPRKVDPAILENYNNLADKFLSEHVIGI